jgi:hypothetical protein
VTTVIAPPARFSLGRAFSAGLGLIARYPASLLVAAAVFGYAPTLASEAVSRHFLVNQPNPATAGGDWGAYWRGFALSELVAILVSGMSFLLQAYVVFLSASEAGISRAEPAELFRKVIKVAPMQYALGLVVTTSVAIGTLALIIPGLLIALAWTVTAQVGALEGRGFIGSLRRSADLTRGHRWALFGLLLLLELVSASAAATARITAGGSFLRLSASDSPVLAYVIAPAVAGVMATVTAAMRAAVYFELAAAKDGVASRQLADTFD